MNDILPDTHKPETPKRQNLWMFGAIGAVLILGLLYGVFKAMPNQDGGADLSRSKFASIAGLEFLPQPPIQPTAPIFTASGSPTTLADFKGKVVLVNLWATWCAPCVTEMPMLANLQKSFAGRDFLVVAVSVDRESDKAEAVARLAELSRGALPFFHDPRMAIVYPMKARGFPTSVLYNREGEEIARLAGEADWDSPEAKVMIEAALSQK
jgi:thiol-disulfide isomerase/thioredoxin